MPKSSGAQTLNHRSNQRFWQTRNIILVLLFAIALATTFLISHMGRQQGVIEIAVNLPAEPGVDSSLALDAQEMFRGSQMYIDEVNQAGGMNGKRLKLVPYETRGSSDKEYALEQAQNIVDSNALGVVGGYFSSVTAPSGEVYAEGGIPALTGIATADAVTEGNDWFFRVIANGSWRSAFIGAYVNDVMEYETASIVVNPEDVGFSLAMANGFQASFEEHGGSIDQTWLTTESSIQAIANQVVDANPEVLFLALQPGRVASYVAPLRRQGYKNPIFLATSAWTAETLAGRAQEQANIGSLTNNVYATSQLIYDVANQAALAFRSRYAQEYEDYDARWVTAISYDATKVLVEAMKRSAITGDRNQVASERQLIRDELAKITEVKQSVQGLSGSIFFNQNGDFETAPAVGFFQNRQFISAFKQLKLDNQFSSQIGLQPREQIERLLAENDLLLVNNVPMKVANIVYTGIDVNKVLSIDQKESLYSIDFYLWFRYRQEEQNQDFDPQNIEMINSDSVTLSDDGIRTEIDDGVITRTYRITGDFREPFEFYNYPFDTQKLAIRFRHRDLTRSELVYVVDLLGMRDTEPIETLKNWRENDVFSLITDWQLKKVSFFPDVLINFSSLGSIQSGSQDDLEYSRFNAVIEVERNRAAFLLKNLLPLFFFLMVGYTNFFIPFKDLKFAAVTSLLMAVVFFHLNLLNKLPERVGYIVTLDYGFYVVYAMLGFQILLFVIGYNKTIQSNPIYLRRLMMTGRIVYPLTIVAAAIAVLYRYG